MKPRGEGRIFRRKGSGFWWCAYYLRGKEYRESTGETDPKKADKFLKRRLKEVGADQIGAKHFVGPQQQHIKISELLDALEADYKLRGKASPQFLSHIAHIREQFGFVRAIQLTSEMVDTYIEQRLVTGAAPATINRGTQLLSQGFKLAIDRKHLSTAPLIRHLSEKGNARQGFFSDAELRAIVGNLPDYLQDFTLFAYLVGWRKGEIASLAWADVDGDVIRLQAKNSKNRKGRLIVLEGELAELIERRRLASQTITAQGSTALASLIFHRNGCPIRDIRRAWKTACKLTGIHRLFHDLRRTAVRNMIRAGVGETVAMEVSGHKTPSMLDRYNIVSETDLRFAMRRTQDYLKGTVEKAQLSTRPATIQ